MDNQWDRMERDKEMARKEIERLQAQLAEQEVLISKSGAMIIKQQAQLAAARAALEAVGKLLDNHLEVLSFEELDTYEVYHAAIAAMEEKP